MLEPGDRVTCTGRPEAGAHRHLRPPRLPPDPEGQVRPSRPVTAHAGRAARREPRHRRRPHAARRHRAHRDHRRDRRGQDAARRGGRAARWARGPTPSLVRDGCDRGARRGPVRRRRRRGARARARAARRRAQRAPTSTDDSRPSAELAAVGATLVDLHGQNSHQSLLAPAVQRAALDRFAGAPAARSPRRPTARPAPTPRATALELDSLGGDARARARELDLLRFQIGEIEQAGLDDPGEDVALEAEEALLRDAAEHRAALASAHDALENRGYDAVGVAASALADRRPVRRPLEPAPVGARRARRSRERAAAGCGARPRRSRTARDGAGRGASSCASCSASTATRSPRCSPSRARPAPASPSSRATRTARPRSRRREPRPRRRSPPRTSGCRRPAARPPARSVRR